jgi:hypothetical protein
MFQAKPLRQWSLVGLFFLICNCFGKIRRGTHQTLGLIELKNRPSSEQARFCEVSKILSET